MNPAVATASTCYPVAPAASSPPKKKKQIPDLHIASVEAASKDPDTISTLEDALSGWSATLAGVMQRESERKPAGKGPLAEIELWRSRSAILGGLSEQLALPHVQLLLAVAEAGSDDRNLLSAFKSQMVELSKLATEVCWGRVKEHARLTGGTCCRGAAAMPPVPAGEAAAGSRCGSAPILSSSAQLSSPRALLIHCT